MSPKKSRKVTTSNIVLITNKILSVENGVVMSLFLILLRLPSLFEPYWNNHELTLLLAGRILGNNSVESFVPLIPPLTQIVANLSFNLINFKLIGLLSSLISLWLFRQVLIYTMVKQNLRNLILIAFTFIIGTPLFMSTTTTSTLLALPWMLASLNMYFRSLQPKVKFKTNHLIWLIVLSFISIGFDYLGVIGIIAMIIHRWFFYKSSISKYFSYYRSSITLSIIFCLLITALLYSLNLWRPHLNITSIFSYLTSANPTWANDYIHHQLLATPLTRLVLAILGLVIAAVVGRREAKQNAFLLVWLAVSSVCLVVVSRETVFQYLFLLAPLLIIMGKLIGTKNITKSTKQSLVAIGFVLVTFSWIDSQSIYKTISYYQNFIAYLAGNKQQEDFYAWFDAHVPAYYHIANWLYARIPNDLDYIIWGEHPAIYLLTNSLPRVQYRLIQFNELKSQLNQVNPDYIIVDNNSELAYTMYLATLSEYVPIHKIDRFVILNHLTGSTP